jgi:hypothetical protein
MAGNLEKVLKVVAKTAIFAEQRMKKELDALAKSGLISKKDAKQALKLAVKEAKSERERFRKFIEAELKRELRKAKPLVKKALAKKKKQFLAYRKKRKR